MYPFQSGKRIILEHAIRLNLEHMRLDSYRNTPLDPIWNTNTRYRLNLEHRLKSAPLSLSQKVCYVGMVPFSPKFYPRVAHQRHATLRTQTL